MGFIDSLNGILSGNASCINTTVLNLCEADDVSGYYCKHNIEQFTLHYLFGSGGIIIVLLILILLLLIVAICLKYKMNKLNNRLYQLTSGRARNGRVANGRAAHGIVMQDLRAGPVADSPRDLSPAEHEQDGADRVSVQAEVEDLEQEREARDADAMDTSREENRVGAGSAKPPLDDNKCPQYDVVGGNRDYDLVRNACPGYSDIIARSNTGPGYNSVQIGAIAGPEYDTVGDKTANTAAVQASIPAIRTYSSIENLVSVLPKTTAEGNIKTASCDRLDVVGTAEGEGAASKVPVNPNERMLVPTYAVVNKKRSKKNEEASTPDFSVMDAGKDTSRDLEGCDMYTPSLTSVPDEVPPVPPRTYDLSLMQSNDNMELSKSGEGGIASSTSKSPGNGDGSIATPHSASVTEVKAQDVRTAPPRAAFNIQSSLDVGGYETVDLL